MKTLWQIIVGVFSVLGCLLGAGFISGAEINTFFCRFGLWGVLGIVISCVIFAVAIIYNKNNASGKLNLLPYCQLFISGAMFAGFVDVINNMLNINYYIVFSFAAMFLFIALVLGIRFANIFNIVVSIAVIFILPLVIKNVGFHVVDYSANGNICISLLFAIFYAVINIVACLPVINNLQQKHKKAVGVICGILVLVLLLIMYFLLYGRAEGNSVLIPNLISNKVLYFIYIIVYVVAMLSTLFSASSGSKQVFNKMENNFFQSLCTCLALCSISLIGFEKIINYVYPLIGAAFLVQIVYNKMYKQCQKSQKYTKITQK